MSGGLHSNVLQGDYVLIARDDFAAGEELGLRCRGTRRILNALSNYEFLVENLRNGKSNEVHSMRLKFYHDACLDKHAILFHVLTIETSMQVARVLRLVEDGNSLRVAICWKGLEAFEDKEESTQIAYEDTPRLLLKLLNKNSTPHTLPQKARVILAL